MLNKSGYAGAYIENSCCSIYQKLKSVHCFAAGVGLCSTAWFLYNITVNQDQSLSNYISLGSGVLFFSLSIMASHYASRLNYLATETMISVNEYNMNYADNHTSAEITQTQETDEASFFSFS